MNRLRYFWVALILLVSLGLLMNLPVFAQSQSEAWNSLVNLSNSGSASQARIVARADGMAQVFWMDQFDGLMTAVYTNESWSKGRSAGLGYAAIREMPVFVVDVLGVVHAVWQEAGIGSALWHSRAELGTSNWSMPEIIAESAVTFDVTAGNTGGISIAYIRPLSDIVYPAGIYVRRWWNEGYWGMARVVDTELYYRQWEVEGSWLRLVDTGGGKIVVAWQDTRRDQAYSSLSNDYGLIWSEKEMIGDEGNQRNPRLILTNEGRILMITQVENISGCSLYQQELGSDDLWGKRDPILSTFTICPREEIFFQHENGLVWIWGLGSDQLSTAIWRPEASSWLQGGNLFLSFSDEITGGVVMLNEQWVAVSGGRAYIAGSSDTLGDVWGAWASFDALEFKDDELSLWSTMVELPVEGKTVGCISVAMDKEGKGHVVWCEGENPDQLTSLRYGTVEDGKASQPIELAAAANAEVIRQPWLVTEDAGWLHLVWSGGETGEIMYRRARVGESGSGAGWSAMKSISGHVLGAAPQMVVDSARNVYVVYVVKVNEGRGVYVVRSTDGGVSWEDPLLVFDAELAKVGMVDYPALVVVGNIVHVAWVEMAGPELSPLNIGYMRGEWGGGEWTWTKPVVVLGAGYDRPRLIAAQGFAHLLCISTEDGLWARTLPLRGGSWGTALQIPGWIVLGDSYGLTTTGSVTGGSEGELHLLGASPDGLTYELWSDGRWKKMEEWKHPGLQIVDVSASTVRQGGKMVVAFTTMEDNRDMGLYMVNREVGTAKVDAAPTAVVVQEAIASATPEPTVARVPTSTPDLNLAPAPGSSLPMPLILGAGLALLVVLVGVFWGLRNKT